MNDYDKAKLLTQLQQCYKGIYSSQKKPEGILNELANALKGGNPPAAQSMNSSIGEMPKLIAETDTKQNIFSTMETLLPKYAKKLYPSLIDTIMKNHLFHGILIHMNLLWMDEKLTIQI